MQLITSSVKDYLSKSVLCWLATSNKNNKPNVSPKEIFCYYDSDGKESILIANIASPGSIKNIKENPLVCISFIDIFIQKGYQIHATAEIISIDNNNFDKIASPLLKLVNNKFPIQSVIRLYPTRVKPILAPSYLLNKETTEVEQILQAKKRYSL